MKATLELPVLNQAGLHASPTSPFARTAARFSADIQICNKTTGGKPVNAKSILSVLTLGVCQNYEISIEASGDDAAEAVQALRELVENNFGEEILA
jgi:phosphotransferase system HPr (HPr) family protein